MKKIYYNNKEYVSKYQSDIIINVLIFISVAFFFIGIVVSDNYYKEEWQQNHITLLEESKEALSNKRVFDTLLLRNQECLEEINNYIDMEIGLIKQSSNKGEYK